MSIIEDLAVGAAESAVASKLEGNAKENKHKDNWFIRFIVTIIWLVISIGIDVVAVFTHGFVIGAVAEFIFFVITFCVPYLRRKGSYTRWFGILALLQAGWLVFLMTKG